ncbi:porin [Zhongshania sp. BJYM1]|uniref:porin n=1 Tax=Zhongshania aquatica TaxID=2965069 RepID=UPI0022B2F97A|nr:porin [Marortus sp. BJYM1]
MNKNLLASLVAATVISNPIYAQTVEMSASELAKLQQQISELQSKLTELQQQVEAATAGVASNSEAIGEEAGDADVAVQAKSEDGITVGGAVRTNFSYTSYNEGNKDRSGDFDFDIFRVNFTGVVGDVSLNGEIRFFDYMTAIKYAYAGYQFSQNWQVQAGVAKVPFGNSPYNSHNYFFSANYYLGLEDDFDLGVVFKRSVADNWQLDLAFFKNDELGGVDGYVDNRSDRYSYDIVGARAVGEGIYDDPTQPLGEYNTFSGRFAYHFSQSGFDTEVGVSALSGGLHDGNSRAGDYQAWALHASSRYENWHAQFQHSNYHYDIDQVDRIAVGAYSFYDSIAAEATSSTFNLAYDLAVNFGAVTALQFYNNYGIVYDKSDNTANTVMNITGVSVAAGGLFTYFDWVYAKNQPFVGGSAAGDSSDFEHRFNINIGYYF